MEKATIRGLALALSLVALAGPGFACPNTAGIKASALTGTWTVYTGAAQTGGAPMKGGSDKVSMQSSGDGITLEIEGKRIALQRVSGKTAAWKWKKSKDVPVSSSDFEIAVGCANSKLARFEGVQKVAGQTVSWRVIIDSPKRAFILWRFPGPPASTGSFVIEK